jgi:uncharacterized membrane protein YeaQ/YmgE (transglycosylase-associated protein family)
MELVLWLVAGAVLGWMGIGLVGMNKDRGTIVSVVIGAIGGVIGGKLVAPMVGAVAAAPGEFSLPALIVVMASSAALLVLGNLVHNRYGV